MSDKKEIKEIIDKNVLVFKKENNNFFLTKKDSNWIFDFRRAFLQAELLQKFSSFFWDKYEKYYPFQVGGLELGAIPFVSGIIFEGIKRGKNINGFFVRKDRKESGLGNVIEGKLNQEKIIIVDDLFNSGKSISKVFFSIKNLEKDVFKIFVFVNFGNILGKNFLIENNLKLDYEFTLSDFGLDFFGNSKKIQKENYMAPMIFPKFQKIFSLTNSNKFLQVPKSSPIKDGKNIYLAGEGANFISICSDTGNVNWKFIVDSVKGHKNILSSPIIFGDNIIFGAYDGNLYCLDKNTGEKKWIYGESDWIGASPIISQKYGMVYVGLEFGGLKNKGGLVGVDLKSGEKKWLFLFDDFVHCSPGYSEKLGFVVCGSNDGKLICVLGKNGKENFSKQFEEPIKGGFDFSSDGKKVFFGCFDKYFYCLDLLSGDIDWKFLTGNIIYSKPLIIDKNIFFGSTDKFFYHLDCDGNLIKKVRTFGKIFGEPTFIKDGIIAFGSNDGYIYFYDYVNKITIFVVEHGEKISTKVIFDNNLGHLYVEDFMNEIYKYYVGGFLK